MLIVNDACAGTAMGNYKTVLLLIGASGLVLMVCRMPKSNTQTHQKHDLLELVLGTMYLEEVDTVEGRFQLVNHTNAKRPWAIHSQSCGC